MLATGVQLVPDPSRQAHELNSNSTRADGSRQA